jgi:hypothetical protein
MGIELARKALDHLNAHPDTFDASVWIDRDCTDLAGRIVLQEGAQPLFDRIDGDSTHRAWYADCRWDIPHLARILIGITGAEAAILFDHRNTLFECSRMVTLLEADRLICDEAGRPRVACEQTWMQRGSVPVIWCHRRTTVIQQHGRYEVTNHDSRERASDYAGDIAACRTLTYHHDTHIWENLT